MAKYVQLTAKQQLAIDELMKEAAVYKKQIDRCNQKLASDILINFEENKRVRKTLRQFEQRYKNVSAKIDNIIHAREEFDNRISKLKEDMTEAETLKATWGF